MATTGTALTQPQRDFLTTEYQQCRSAIGGFDDILVRLRTQGLAFVLAFDGVAAIVSDRMVVLSIFGIDVRAAAIIQLVSIILVIPVFTLDWLYTKFLLAAVTRAQAIEQALSMDLPLADIKRGSRLQLPLSSAIGRAVGPSLATRGIHLVVYPIVIVGGGVLAYLYLSGDIIKGG
jgi:hypothetical protein